MPPGVVGLSIAHMFYHVKLGGWGCCLYLTQGRRGRRGIWEQIGGGEAARQRDSSEKW